MRRRKHKIIMFRTLSVWDGTSNVIVRSSPITVLDRPRGFHEVKDPRFHDNGTGWW